MKHGFRLIYHKDIAKEDISYCLEFLSKKIKDFQNGYGCRRLSGAFFRRGVLGLTIDKDCKYTFKRLCKHRRIFGIVPIRLLKRVDMQPIELNNCMCAMHRGGQRVKLIYGFIESDYIIFYEEGEIKG